MELARSADRLSLLRATVAAMERATPWQQERRTRLGVPALDAAVGGAAAPGLPHGTLHEIVPAGPFDQASASGFALALAGLAESTRPVVWIIEEMALREAGRPHGEGLPWLGLSPERLLLVRVPGARPLLWAAEEVLRSRATAAVVLEIWGQPALLGDIAFRRLVLAAEQAGCLGLVVRGGAAAGPGLPAATRWRIGAHPSGEAGNGALAVPAGPAFACALLRNRFGPLLRDNLAFDAALGRFRPLADAPFMRTPGEQDDAAFPRPLVSRDRHRSAA
jgi:protein ImuA